MDVHPPSKVQDFFHPPYCIYRYVYPIISPFFMVSPTLITIFSHTSTGFWSIATTCKSHCCCCWWFPPCHTYIMYGIYIHIHLHYIYTQKKSVYTYIHMMYIYIYTWFMLVNSRAFFLANHAWLTVFFFFMSGTWLAGCPDSSTELVGSGWRPLLMISLFVRLYFHFSVASTPTLCWF